MKRPSSRKTPEAAAPTSWRPRFSHLALFAVGVAVALLVKDLVRSPAAPQTVAPIPLATTNPPGSALGPWGRLEYTTLALDRPEEYFQGDFSAPALPAWVFANHTEQQLESLFDALELKQSARQQLKDRRNWQILPRAIRVTASPETILSLAPETRARLYSLLGLNPENSTHAAPFRFRLDGFDEWFAGCGMAPEKLELVRSLVYAQENSLCFADAATFAKVSSPEETKRLLQCLWRVSTLMLKLRLQPGDDVEKILAYWGRLVPGGNYRPLVQSMARVPEGSAMNISYFLPPFARLRLYTYPDPRDPTFARQDCFWSAMNFFNAAPDSGFFNPEYTQTVLRNEYVKNPGGPKQFGDILLLLGARRLALHMCVFVADDIVFTKNGASTQQPWVLMKLPEMLSQYQAEKPFEIVVYRRKAPIRLGSAFQLSGLPVSAL